MTNEEAIKHLEFLKIAALWNAKPLNVNTEAIDLAIKALGNGIPEVEPAEFLKKGGEA